MINLKPITWDNFKEICDLEIHEHQFKLTHHDKMLKQKKEKREILW